MNLIGPSHRGHFRASTSHTRCSNVAHSIREGRAIACVRVASDTSAGRPPSPSSQIPASLVAGRAPAALATPAAAADVATALAAQAFTRRSSSYGRSPGTTAVRHGEWGATTPW
jgi:hypothetical protein